MDGSSFSADRLDSGLACLVIAARLHQVAVDPGQLQHQFGRSGETFGNREIVLAARWLKLKARKVTADWATLGRTALPAIARTRDGRYLLLARIGEDSVLAQDPGAGRPLKLEKAQFLKDWSGDLVLLSRRASLTDELRRFDFSWFIPAIVAHRGLLGEVLLASFFVQLAALVTPLFFQVVIDKVLVHKGLSTLDVLATGLLTIAVFEVTLGGLRSYVFAHTANRIDVVLGARLFRHLLALPVSYFEVRRVGDTVARVRELESIRNFLTGSAMMSVLDAFFIVVFIAVLYYYSPLLTTIVAGTIPFYIALSVGITPVLRARLHEKFNRGAENQAFLVESINGIETVKASAIEPQSQRRWEEQLAGYVKAGFKATNLGNIANQCASLINKVMVVLILWIGARQVMEGNLTVGQLVAFNMLAGRVSGPILKIVQLWQEFQQAGISVQRLGDVLNAQPEPAFNPARTSLPTLAGHVAFKDVVFRYRPDGPVVLDGIDLQVHAGELIGIVGRSGSGKSTLTKLIQRLHVPERGRVSVDGADLATIDPAWLRRNIGVVLQENFLFNRSIRDNIAISDPALPMEPIMEAAELAGAHEFIAELEEGYDSRVFEHGRNLSGGQRQRLAIARALVSNPRILIFDEATSALDYESESIIQSNMRRICQGRTVFVIAHRLSAVRHSDRILVMEAGRIVEQGTHQSLLASGGRYAGLHALQDPVASVGQA